MVKMTKIIISLLLILFSSNALAASESKLDATTMIIIFIVGQVLSIIGIVTLGFKRKNKKKEDVEK